MLGDMPRTPVLKDYPNFHHDAMRVIEFYCFAHNVSYCQGMFEVLVPFLFMKQHGVDDSVSEVSGVSREQG